MNCLPISFPPYNSSDDGGGGVGGLGSVREVQLKAHEGLAYFSDFVAGENLVDLKSGGGRRDGSVDRVGGRGHAR